MILYYSSRVTISRVVKISVVRVVKVVKIKWLMAFISRDPQSAIYLFEGYFIKRKVERTELFKNLKIKNPKRIEQTVDIVNVIEK